MNFGSAIIYNIVFAIKELFYYYIT